jgi:hypothetical protein
MLGTMSSVPASTPSPATRLRAALGSDRTLLIVVVGLVAVYLVRYLIWNFSRVDYHLEGSSDWVGSDFVCFWLAAKFLFSHAAPHVYHIPTFTAFELSHISASEGLFYPWIYPPFALLLVAPLGLMPYAVAYAAFMAATFLAYAVLAGGLRPKLWFVALLLLSPAATVNLIGGQNGFLTAGLLIGGILLLDRRPVWAGILFGLLAIKPQLGLLIPVALIAGGLWRPFIAAALTGIVLVAASIFFYGFDIWPAYLEAVSVFRETVVALDTGFINLQPTVFAAMRLWGTAAPLAYAAQAVVTLGLAAGIWTLFRKSTDRPLQAAAIGFAVLLTTPYGFVYDMPVVAISCIILGWRGFNEGFLPGERLALICGWLLPITVMNLNPLHMPVGPVVLLALFALTMRRALGSLPQTAVHGRHIIMT